MLNISLSRHAHTLCDGATRRSFLQVGSLGAIGLSLGSVLRAEATAVSTPKNSQGTADGKSSAKPRAKSIILVYLGGGLSHHDTFDLKPDAP
jgi:hypothetical protein